MKRKAKAQTPWEATISVWGSVWGQGRIWWWSIWRSFDPQIAVHSTVPCKSRKAAYEEARQVLKLLGLVEKKT